MDPKQSRWTPRRSKGSPSHQSGATEGPLATASHQVRPNGETTWGTLLQTKRCHVENTSEVCILKISAMSLILKPYGFQLGPKWPSSWGQVAHLGPKLGVGGKWVQVGPKLLAEVDPKSGQCCGHIGSKRCIWMILGRSADLQNMYISTLARTSWRPALSKMPPPPPS